MEQVDSRWFLQLKVTSLSSQSAALKVASWQALFSKHGTLVTSVIGLSSAGVNMKDWSTNLIEITQYHLQLGITK